MNVGDMSKRHLPGTYDMHSLGAHSHFIYDTGRGLDHVEGKGRILPSLTASRTTGKQGGADKSL